MSGSKEVFRWDILMIDQSREQVKSDRKVRNWVLPKIVLCVLATMQSLSIDKRDSRRVAERRQ